MRVHPASARIDTILSMAEGTSTASFSETLWLTLFVVVVVVVMVVFGILGAKGGTKEEGRLRVEFWW